MSDHKRSLLERTTEIVMSYAANNTFDPDRLPQLLKEVHRALRELERADRQDPPPPRLPTSDIGFYVAALATFLGGDIPGRRHSWAATFLGGDIPGRRHSWAATFLGGDIPGRRHSWAATFLGGDIPGRRHSWAATFLGGDIPGRRHVPGRLVLPVGFARQLTPCGSR